MRRARRQRGSVSSPTSRRRRRRRRRGLALRARARQLIEREIGYYPVSAAPAGHTGIDDDLFGAAEQPLHRFEIYALASHFGRFLVLIIDLQVSRGLAFGLGDG